MRRRRNRTGAMRHADATMAEMGRRVRAGRSGDLWAIYDEEMRLLHSPFPSILRRGAGA